MWYTSWFKKFQNAKKCVLEWRIYGGKGCDKRCLSAIWRHNTSILFNTLLLGHTIFHDLPWSWNKIKGIAGDHNAWKLFMDAQYSTRSKRIWCSSWMPYAPQGVKGFDDLKSGHTEMRDCYPMHCWWVTHFYVFLQDVLHIHLSAGLAHFSLQVYRQLDAGCLGLKLQTNRPVMTPYF
jgi:hypothetical protein